MLKRIVLIVFSLVVVFSSKGQTQEESNAAWMAGEYGVWFQLFGGSRLDGVLASNYDYVAGAEEIVEKLPSSGYVLTSLTNSAHGYYFTLHDNTKMDVASIHSDFVPSKENEQVILDVIDVFKNAGKKVLLYVATDGPGASAGTPDNEEYTAAWNAFVDSDYDGDEALAYRDLCQGFMERLAPVVDGYWLDHVGGMAGEPEDFVEMIRSVDPTAAIALNNGSEYFTYDDNSFVWVPGEPDFREERDFKIKKHIAHASYADYTGGHPTPLGHGAPPNHWSVEEFTHCDMINSPWDTLEGNSILKHAFVPMQDYWTPPTATLQFTDVDQAYRFARRLTDAGAAMTWSTSNSFGKMSEDEMAILEEVDRRLQMSPMPDYIPYERPEGASLVGDDITCEETYLIDDCASLSMRPRTEVYGDVATSGLSIVMTLSDSIIFKPQIAEDDVVSVGDGTWTWEGPNSFNLTGRTFSLEPVEADDFGVYTVTYTSGQCSVMAEIELILDEVTSLNIGTNQKVSVYPNPTNDIIHLLSSENTQYEIYNSLGEQLQNGKINSNDHPISLKEYPSGLYILNVLDGENTRRIQIIRE